MRPKEEAVAVAKATAVTVATVAAKVTHTSLILTSHTTNQRTIITATPTTKRFMLVPVTEVEAEAEVLLLASSSAFSAAFSASLCVPFAKVPLVDTTTSIMMITSRE